MTACCIVYAWSGVRAVSLVLSAPVKAQWRDAPQRAQLPTCSIFITVCPLCCKPMVSELIVSQACGVAKPAEESQHLTGCLSTDGEMTAT
jgi:hypothetical protein